MVSKKIIGVFLLLAGMTARAQNAYDSSWNDPQTEKRIEDGIIQNRTAMFSVRIEDSKGKAVTGAKVNISMRKHEFIFGANIFMLGGFDTPEKNRKYEEVFTHFFNGATVPFYWKQLEPQQGHVRFEKNSEPSYRRPPPDAVLEFCLAHGIHPKGHPLVWDNPAHGIPDFWPTDTAQQEALLAKRIEQIGKRYGDSIPTWEVVNEVCARSMVVRMPKDYAWKAFNETQKYFPAKSELLINETTRCWQDFKGEYSPYYMLIQNLMLRGARIEGIGMQFHFFENGLWDKAKAGQAMTPRQLFAVLDRYSDFGKPIHITEITIPTLPEGAEGEAWQAKATRNFYRLWFSHPSVKAITWWNVGDGTAVKGEDKWRGGFIREDFSPKPAYTALDELINKEWRTKVDTSTDKAGSASFRAFYGDYEVTVQYKGKKQVRTVTLGSAGPREKVVVID